MMRRFFRRASNALAYIRRGEWKELSARLRFMLRRTPAQRKPPEGPLDRMSWAIVTPPHGTYIATLIARRLQAWGVKAEILHGMPGRFHHDYYIVLAPQVFSRLPPGERLYIYQLEQTLASDWFSKKYLHQLENCRAVLEYKQGNLPFLAGQGIAYPHVYHLPMGGNPDLFSAENPPRTARGALFYGAWKANARRRELLSALENVLPITRHDQLFAPALYDDIRRTSPLPVVLNLHHYDPAQLETPRLWEAVSLGVPVVSEDSPDGHEDPLLRQALHCVPAGDRQALAQALLAAAHQVVDPASRQSLIAAGWQRFSFYFDRFLLAEGFVSSEDPRLSPQAPDTLPALADAPENIPPRWCLTLPETDARYRSACRLPVGRHYVGLRKRPGWQGCALSYRQIARDALAQGLQALWVFEDDISLPADFEARIAEIWQHLAERDDWDICVGHLTLVDAALDIAAIDRLPSGNNLLHVNQFLGMAANLYHRRALEIMAGWRPDTGDEYDNTIDQYMKAQGLRTVAAWPYLAQHDDEQQSTLWGFNNAHYRSTIEATRQRLDELCRPDQAARN